MSQLGQVTRPTSSRYVGSPRSPPQNAVPTVSMIHGEACKFGRLLSTQLQEEYFAIDTVVSANTRRLSTALQECVNHEEDCWIQDELGQSSLDRVVSLLMGTESAIASMRLLSGTHAISAALFACLRPGDELLCLCGPPYDTLEEVIGCRGISGQGSLADFGVVYRYIPFPIDTDGNIDINSIQKSIVPGQTRVCHIQRSCGYSLRHTLTISEIRLLIQAVRSIDSSIVITVDNCYGEFTEVQEPGHAGADVVMGSFIKNPGGTLSTGGGYIAGRKDVITAVRTRFGAQRDRSHDLRMLLQGLWLSPSRVGEALKGGRLIARYAENSGLIATPNDPATVRPSFITAIQLGSPEKMVQFCEVVQRNSPIGSYVHPVAGPTPGYDSQVIFADGTFVDGCTSELSADGPLRPPFVVYCQGGIHWTHWLNVLSALAKEHTQCD